MGMGTFLRMDSDHTLFQKLSEIVIVPRKQEPSTVKSKRNKIRIFLCYDTLSPEDSWGCGWRQVRQEAYRRSIEKQIYFSDALQTT